MVDAAGAGGEEVGRLLAALGGEATSAEERAGIRRRLFDLLYREIHDLAGRLRRRGAGASLQTTALVHEAYLRLMGTDGLAPRDRTHFLAIAARAMRGVLVDHVRARRAAKRGGGWSRVPLDDLAAAFEERSMDLEALNTRLEELAAEDERAAVVVDLHFFGGLSLPEVAKVLGLSGRSIERDLRFARAWLRRGLAP